MVEEMATLDKNEAWDLLSCRLEEISLVANWCLRRS
jgi:hypothetical protein